MSSKFYDRFLRSRLEPGGSAASGRRGRNKVVLLFGARQTGKSTLLNHCVGAGRTTFVVNLQDRRQRRRYEAEVGLLAKEIEADDSIDTVLIDEIQKVPEMLEDIQYLYDKDPRRLRIFLSGSSARQLKRRSSNLLPGRVQSLLLTPVLQAEQRKCVLLPLPMGRKERFPVRPLNEYLIYGNLPGLYQEDKVSWAETLAAYVELYIENEIRQENIVHDMGAFLRFIRLAALESGQYVNYTKLSGVIGVAVNTMRNFYQVLEDTYLGIRIQPFAQSRKRIISAPRFLIFDLGVRHLLAELPLSEALVALDPGHLFEQWVMAELYYRCRCAGKGYRISTWKTVTGAEVDVVLETPETVIPIEIKWTERPSRQDTRHVETFLDVHGKRAQRGYIICRCLRKQRLSDRVTALPWNEF
ncbi:MAG: AAA family ATPase [PVC group bacterium]